MIASHQDLLSAFRQRRDESSFRRLYRQHTPMLFALALRLTGSNTEAEEITQETWVRSVAGIEQFSGRSKDTTWLAGILINCFRESSRARVRARTGYALNSACDPAAEGVVTAFPVRSNLPADPIDVERALTRLPEGFREVVILHDLNGYTHQEIADMLGIREGTSKSQLARGRARLRELLINPTSSPERCDERGTS